MQEGLNSYERGMIPIKNYESLFSNDSHHTYNSNRQSNDD
jgi:hypothetical protein